MCLGPALQGAQECLKSHSVQVLVLIMFVCCYCLGGRTADAIVREGLSIATMVANDRLGGKKTGSGGGRPGGGGGGTPGNDVVELTDGNFEEMVIKSEDYWLVEFYAPWYVHGQRKIYFMIVWCVYVRESKTLCE